MTTLFKMRFIKDMRYLYLGLAILIFTLGCKDKVQETYTTSQVIDSRVKHNEHPGKKLMEMYCYVCHNPTTDHDNRIAPPMEAIKRHYMSQDTSKENFIASMLEWVKNPIEDKAKMPGAVRRFGVMPKAIYPEDDVRKIAEYVYSFDIEQPSWFEAHYNQEHGKGSGNGRGNNKGQGKGKQKHGLGQGKNNQTNYGDLGLKVAMTTKQELGKNLIGTIQREGTLEALKFCNIKAYPLTDSMAVVHNALIKRVSDKPRNPKNQANSVEIAQIEAFKWLLKEEKEINPITIDYGEKIQFYYPIITNSMCLQCHGSKKTDIKEETYKTLKGLYPDDKATGYEVNNVRGIWSITLNKN